MNINDWTVQYSISTVYTVHYSSILLDVSFMNSLFCKGEKRGRGLEGGREERGRGLESGRE